MEEEHKDGSSIESLKRQAIGEASREKYKQNSLEKKKKRKEIIDKIDNEYIYDREDMYNWLPREIDTDEAYIKLACYSLFEGKLSESWGSDGSLALILYNFANGIIPTPQYNCIYTKNSENFYQSYANRINKLYDSLYDNDIRLTHFQFGTKEHATVLLFEKIKFKTHDYIKIIHVNTGFGLNEKDSHGDMIDIFKPIYIKDIDKSNIIRLIMPIVFFSMMSIEWCNKYDVVLKYNKHLKITYKNNIMKPFYNNKTFDQYCSMIYHANKEYIYITLNELFNKDYYKTDREYLDMKVYDQTRMNNSYLSFFEKWNRNYDIKIIEHNPYIKNIYLNINIKHVDDKLYAKSQSSGICTYKSALYGLLYHFLMYNQPAFEYFDGLCIRLVDNAIAGIQNFIPNISTYLTTSYIDTACLTELLLKHNLIETDNDTHNIIKHTSNTVELTFGQLSNMIKVASVSCFSTKEFNDIIAQIRNKTIDKVELIQICKSKFQVDNAIIYNAFNCILLFAFLYSYYLEYDSLYVYDPRDIKKICENINILDFIRRTNKKIELYNDEIIYIQKIFANFYIIKDDKSNIKKYIEKFSIISSIVSDKMIIDFMRTNPCSVLMAIKIIDIYRDLFCNDAISLYIVSDKNYIIDIHEYGQLFSFIINHLINGEIIINEKNFKNYLYIIVYFKVYIPKDILLKLINDILNVMLSENPTKYIYKDLFYLGAIIINHIGTDVMLSIVDIDKRRQGIYYTMENDIEFPFASLNHSNIEQNLNIEDGSKSIKYFEYDEALLAKTLK